MAKGVQYSKEVDVWSFGCFAYELATGKMLFQNTRNKRHLVYKILNDDAPAIPDRWSDTFKDFVKCCLKRDPTERHTIR